MVLVFDHLRLPRGPILGDEHVSKLAELAGVAGADVEYRGHVLRLARKELLAVGVAHGWIGQHDDPE